MTNFNPELSVGYESHKLRLFRRNSYKRVSLKVPNKNGFKLIHHFNCSICNMTYPKETSAKYCCFDKKKQEYGLI